MNNKTFIGKFKRCVNKTVSEKINESFKNQYVILNKYRNTLCYLLLKSINIDNLRKYINDDLEKFYFSEKLQIQILFNMEKHFENVFDHPNFNTSFSIFTVCSSLFDLIIYLLKKISKKNNINLTNKEIEEILNYLFNKLFENLELHEVIYYTLDVVKDTKQQEIERKKELERVNENKEQKMKNYGEILKKYKSSNLLFSVSYPTLTGYIKSEPYKIQYFKKSKKIRLSKILKKINNKIINQLKIRNDKKDKPRFPNVSCRMFLSNNDGLYSVDDGDNIFDIDPKLYSNY